MRFQYGATTSYGTDTAWGGELQTGDTVGLQLSGLTNNATYHYRAQFKNATDNIISCSDQTFTTGAPAASEIWISPISVTDPDSGWENENNALDDEVASYAKFHREVNGDAWTTYIHFHVPSGTYNGLRVMGRTDNLYINLIDVDVYRNDAWENLYEGAVDDANFQNLPFADGTVTEARVRFHITTPAWGGYLYLYEFDFHKDGVLEMLTEAGSVTSPAWVEGTVWYGSYTVNAAVDSSSATVTKLSGQDWFVTNSTTGNPLGVTLSSTASTAMQIQAYNGASLMATENLSLTWTPTNLTGKSSSTDTVTIRKGDSLLLTGTGSGTAMTIDADGDSTVDYTGVPSDTYAYQYTTAGTYTAEAKIDSTSIGTITVIVVDVTVPASDINGIRYVKRIKEFAVTPATAKSEVYFRGDDFLKLRIDTEAETTGGVNVTYVPGATGSSHLNARLGGRNGAIISRATTNSTYYNFTGMTYEPVLKQFEDGDVLTGQTITLGSALSNMKIKLVMGTGGVTYESTGTNTMYAESGDFDANAQFNYYLVTPPSNNNCHTLDSVTDED